MCKLVGKKDKHAQTSPKNQSEYVDLKGMAAPVWYGIGEENPFSEPILDIRSITLNLVATTRDKSIAENYTISRADDGKKYIEQKIPGGTAYKSNIRYLHNGAELAGIVSKAESMDVKWDIYAYGEWFYFVRSWTSELLYKVHYQNTGNELVLDAIHTSLDTDGVSNLHEQNINSIMLTHVLGRVWPYAIPKSLSSANEKDIALYLFAQFGCKATIATHADTLSMTLTSESL